MRWTFRGIRRRILVGDNSMFLFSKKNTSALSNDERLELTRGLAKAGVKCDGVSFYRSKDLSWRGDTACFSVLFRNSVFLAHDAPLFRLVPKAAHELKHREQFRRMGCIVYLILAFPPWRRWTIEPEAYAEEDRVALYDS